MSQRTPLIAGNWKMHKTVAEAEAYVAGLLPRVADADGVDVALCVPFTALAEGKLILTDELIRDALAADKKAKAAQAANENDEDGDDEE